MQAAIFTNPTTNTYKPLSSYFAGLASTTGVSATAYTGDATTGQIVGTFDAANSLVFGGVCFLFAAAGRYDVSIRFSTAAGTVTAKERRLTVWTEGVSSGMSA